MQKHMSGRNIQNEYGNKHGETQNRKGNLNINVTCNEKTLEKVSTFEYLGVVLTAVGKIGSQITNRVNKANRLYDSMNRIIMRRN